jgi:hypothetical protein
MNKEISISRDKMKQLNMIYHDSVILHICTHMITTQLLNNGIEFKKGNKTKIHLDAREQDIVEEVYIPLCTEIINSVLCYGFVVIIIENDLPYVMPIGSYNITYMPTFSGYIWKVVDPYENTVIKNAHVFSNFGFNPLPTGEIVSIVQKVLPQLVFLKKLRETCLQMEYKRSQVVVFSEIKESTSAAAKEGVDYDFYADASAGEIRDDMKFSRNGSAVNQYNDQINLYDQYLGRLHAKKASNAMENVVPLPSGHSMKAPPMTTGRSDIVALHKTMEEEICATIGIPRSMVIADGGGGLGHSTDTQGIHETFMHTLMWWKKKIGTVLTFLYNRINISKIKDSIDFAKEKDPHEAKANHSFNVYFPVTPYVGNDQLRILYEQGIIPWDIYAKYALLNVSLPLEIMKKGPPPIDALLFEKPKKEPKAKEEEAKEPKEPKEEAKEPKEPKAKEPKEKKKEELCSDGKCNKSNKRKRT